MRLLENGIFEIQTAPENSGHMNCIHSQIAEPILKGATESSYNKFHCGHVLCLFLSIKIAPSPLLMKMKEPRS